jgi:hypothetical protein
MRAGIQHIFLSVKIARLRIGTVFLGLVITAGLGGCIYTG